MITTADILFLTSFGRSGFWATAASRAMPTPPEPLPTPKEYKKSEIKTVNVNQNFEK